jgi:Ca-activated chloride channel family protein
VLLAERRNSAWLIGLIALLSIVLAALLWKLVDVARDGENMRWASSKALLLLAGPFLVWWAAMHLRLSRSPTFWFSRVGDLQATRRGWVGRLTQLPIALRVMALTLIVLALARPQTFRRVVQKLEGIDIMMVLDLSKSMEEKDLHKNRLDAGQRTIREFLQRRRGLGDRIGLVVFAREAMLQCPLTLDYRMLEWLVAGLEIGDVPERGTALGDALGLALASLSRPELKKGEDGQPVKNTRSKVIILISDGDWNWAEFMDPLEAKSWAKQRGVRIFTVLMGREDSGNKQGRGYSKEQYAVNPAVLKSIARDTGGQYFNAGNDTELERSFSEIRKKLKLSENVKVGVAPDKELFPIFLLAALILLALELALRMTRWRSFP